MFDASLDMNVIKFFMILSSLQDCVNLIFGETKILMHDLIINLPLMYLKVNKNLKDS